jgi:hypothetical protein
MEAGIGELLARARHQAAGRIDAAWKRPGTAHDDGVVFLGVVRGRDALADQPVGEEAGVPQPERLQHQFLQRRLVRLAGQRLDQPPGAHSSAGLLVWPRAAPP